MLGNVDDLELRREVRVLFPLRRNWVDSPHSFETKNHWS